MNILCIGDVVGTPGLDFLCRRLPALKRALQVDVCIVNGENSDKSGVGLTRHAAQEIFSHGADVITTGNHFLRRAGLDFYLEEPYILAPANHPALPAEAGCCTLDMGRFSVMAVCLCGVAYLDALKNPFDVLEGLLQKAQPTFCIVDFHAESTAEKKALAYCFDGRVSAIYGTHTHVPTADEGILPAGTGYITDAGMCGPAVSVIGVAPALAIQKQRLHIPVRFETAAGPCVLQGVLFTLDEKSGRCTAAHRITEAE